MSTGYPLESIGPYRVIRLLGRGGFGSVFLAEQTAPVRREVAVKVLNPGMDHAELRTRFAIERETLNLMKHPGIAMLLDAGVTEEDQPYFVMEYVPGKPIDKYVGEKQPDLDDCLELFRGVCSAVQHAHEKGVIHRDLTANNVLIVEVDGRPVPKIIDFGIAKALGGASLDVSMHTSEGMAMGTPAYMSPEQARGDVAQIDTRTDIYALGAQLYSLLTGSLPFTQEQIAGAGVRLFELICEHEPELPSKRVASREETRYLLPILRGDLDWITAKAMAKERDRRYASVAALSEDIRRYLEDEPVLASPPSKRYLLKKALMRHRGPVTAAAALLLSLIIGLVVSLNLYFKSSANARAAQDNLERFNHLSDVLLLETLREEVDGLGAARPENRDAMEAWLRRAEGLVSRADELRTALNSPPDPELSEAERRAEEFLRRELTDLLSEIDAFAESAQSPLANVRARIAWADVVEERTVAAHAEAWRGAAQRVAADPRFGGLALKPQLGLVPLGPDPASGLEEFAALRSGTPPARDATGGALTFDEESGVVLVLIPGGSFHLGAQKADPQSPQYDADVRDLEIWWAHPEREVTTDLVRVELEPYFLSKFEVTQAQWLRMTAGEDPSINNPVEYARYGVTRLCPVEGITWKRSRDVLREFAMDLPTEAQWEFAARAEAGTVWFTGDEEPTLDGYANLADITARDANVNWGNFEGVVLDDGYVFTSPVGSFRPNGFGLYDVIGNAYERCLEPVGPYRPELFTGPDARRAVEAGDEPPSYVVRGGAYRYRAVFARSAHRWHFGAGAKSFEVGVRPARALDR